MTTRAPRFSIALVLLAVVIACGVPTGTLRPSGQLNGAQAPFASPAPAARPIQLQPFLLVPTSNELSAPERLLVLSNASTMQADALTLAIEGRAIAQAGSTPTSLPGEDAHVRLRQQDLARLIASPPPVAYTPLATTPPALGDERSFYVFTGSGQGSGEDVQVRARLIAMGSHCYLFADLKATSSAAESTLLKTRAADVADAFDHVIYPTETRLFGNPPEPGIDGDPHIYLLFTPAVDDYGNNATLGYFAARDEFPVSPRLKDYTHHSNAKELLSFSSRFLLNAPRPDYLGTVAHEFQHLINFNQKYLVGQARRVEDTWLDEALAMYAMHACGFGLAAGGNVLAGYVQNFEEDPDAYSLTNWDPSSTKQAYGAAFLFMAYLADQYSPALVTRLLAGPETGAASLDDALAFSGSDLVKAFRDWSLTNVLDPYPQVTNPRYHYTSLKMRGRTGLTSLPGVKIETLAVPSMRQLQLRPYGLAYYRLSEGSEAVPLGLSPTGGVQIAPWQSLP